MYRRLNLIKKSNFPGWPAFVKLTFKDFVKLTSTHRTAAAVSSVENYFVSLISSIVLLKSVTRSAAAAGIPEAQIFYISL